MTSHIYDLIIIGSGPAGLAAAVYAQRACLDTLIIERSTVSGGQILNTYEVDNYPGYPGISGYELGMKLREHADHLGAQFKEDTVLKIEDKGLENLKQVIGMNENYEARTLILATGAVHKKLGIPGEKELTGAGVSYCATCDGAFFRGRNVAVVGGGNTALEDAMFLSNYCNRVYLIHRRDTFRGEGKNVENVKEKDNINVIYNSIPIRLIYDDVLEGMEIKNVTNSEVTKIDVDGVFVAIGQIPDSEIFKDLLKTDSSGYIVANEDCKTNIEGIFTAGDCREKNIRQLTTAASDGAVAAINACSFIDENYR